VWASDGDHWHALRRLLVVELSGSSDVAKHRLEILKLTRKDPSSSHSGKATAVAAVAAITVVLPWRATRLLAAAVHRSTRSALAAVRTLPAPAGSIAACLMRTDVCSFDEDEEGDSSGSDVEVVVVDSGEEMQWESMFHDIKPT
jgi:hypothetical protein